MTLSRSGKKKIRLRPCSSCGHPFDEEKSQCPICRVWNMGGSKSGTVLAKEVKERKKDDGVEFIATGPWDRCFGRKRVKTNKRTTEYVYGLPRKSVLLVGGYPGAGKSTLAAQFCGSLTKSTQREVLYVGLEEDEEQIVDRLERLNIPLDLIRIYPMTAVSDMGDEFQRYKPAAIIFDSLQGFSKNLDEQVEVCQLLKRHTISLNSPTIIISQVTKEGDFSGLMAMQHAVDATLTLLPMWASYRELAVVKNRFGPDDEKVHFEMTEYGLSTVELNEDDEENDDE